MRHHVTRQRRFLNRAVSFPLLPSSVVPEHGPAASPADAKRWMSVIVCVMTECFNQVQCKAKELSQFLFRRSITWPAAGRCSDSLPGDVGNTCPTLFSSSLAQNVRTALSGWCTGIMGLSRSPATHMLGTNAEAHLHTAAQQGHVEHYSKKTHQKIMVNETSRRDVTSWKMMSFCR